MAYATLCVSYMPFHRSFCALPFHPVVRVFGLFRFIYVQNLHLCCRCRKWAIEMKTKGSGYYLLCAYIGRLRLLKANGGMRRKRAKGGRDTEMCVTKPVDGKLKSPKANTLSIAATQLPVARTFGAFMSCTALKETNERLFRDRIFVLLIFHFIIARDCFRSGATV